MGFKEIAMIVVSLILGAILALNVAPSISASGDATKTSVLNSEFESVVGAAKMWMATSSTSGNFNGITVAKMRSNIPNLDVDNETTPTKFVSKIDPSISYAIAASTTTGTDDSVTVTWSGLDKVSGAEASLKATLASKYGSSNVTDAAATDGILVVKVRG